MHRESSFFVDWRLEIYAYLLERMVWMWVSSLVLVVSSVWVVVSWEWRVCTSVWRDWTWDWRCWLDWDSWWVSFDRATYISFNSSTS